MSIRRRRGLAAKIYAPASNVPGIVLCALAGVILGTCTPPGLDREKDDFGRSISLVYAISALLVSFKGETECPTSKSERKCAVSAPSGNQLPHRRRRHRINRPLRHEAMGVVSSLQSQVLPSEYLSSLAAVC